MSKRFYYMSSIVTGIIGSGVALAGISSLLFFSPVPEPRHLTFLGWLMLSYFVVVLVLSVYVFTMRKQFGENKLE